MGSIYSERNDYPNIKRNHKLPLSGAVVFYIDKAKGQNKSMPWPSDITQTQLLCAWLKRCLVNDHVRQVDDA